MNTALKPEKNMELAGNQDTSLLKVIALLLMLVDHTAIILFRNMEEMRLIGRMAFPLYAWCLVVGSVKTKNIWRYALRLLLLGAASQPLYMMALSHGWADLNILFALFLGVMAIAGIRAKWFGSQIWLPALCFLSLAWLKVDYGWRGIMLMLILYGARKTTSGLLAAYVSFGLFWGSNSAPVTQFFGIAFPFLNWPGIGPVFAAFFRMQGMVWLSLPLILIPMHTRLRMPKWLGYALYPLHLGVLILFRLLIVHTPFSQLFLGF